MSANRQVLPARAGESEHPTIFIAIAGGRANDRVLAIDVGLGEPRLRPSTVQEILLRIEGVGDAVPVEAASPVVARATTGRRVCGRVSVDFEEHRALVGSTAIHLTAMEMRLLAYLVERQGCLCRLGDILSSVWGTVGDTSRRTLNTHVNRLRMKLAGGGVRLETVRNVGLRITEEPVSRQASAPGGPGHTIPRSQDGSARVTPLVPRAPAIVAARAHAAGVR